VAADAGRSAGVGVAAALGRTAAAIVTGVPGLVPDGADRAALSAQDRPLSDQHAVAISPPGPQQAAPPLGEGVPCLPGPRRHPVRISQAPSVRELFWLAIGGATVVLLDDSDTPVAVMMAQPGTAYRSSADGTAAAG
jgi:hypothetical protein